ncbi:MAG TPA: imidazoleglycerol-phosphate dehydratase, partial [Candidatus Acidoferrum sp.]|nr:imidazoleglycerol-phosphate dehydratase [Candidatus Acidoferrum sp.]
MSPRRAKLSRRTRETDIQVELGLDGDGRREVDTPLPFFSHMLDAFARHGLFDMTVRARGDIE